MKTETYIVQQNGKITAVFETAQGIEGVRKSMEHTGKSGQIVLVRSTNTDEPFDGAAGQSIEEFDESWNLRDLQWRADHGFFVPPTGEKVENGELVRMTDADLVRTGLKELSPMQVIDEETHGVRPKTVHEIPREQWLDFYVRPARNSKLDEVDRVYCNPERWSGYTEEQQQAWREYKQSLRDFPSVDIPVTEDIESLPWPELPRGKA